METKLGIIFDMDGTLWDSSEGVAKSWTEAVLKEDKNRQAVTSEQIRSVMGKTMDRIAAALFADLPEAERMELLEKCCENENAYLSSHGGVLYEGLEDTLKLLRENYHLYIVSNCQSGYIEAFLNYYGFWQYFEDIECYGNNGLEKSENIRNIVARNHLSASVYVGDIQADYDASAGAGVKFIHAAYGFGTVEQDVPGIQTIAELPDVVKTVFENG
ncbi:MAG: HAD family hydrolase [Clostridium sp.]|nr:HAD family hydrolase [Clostridium sp.]